ncbi:chromosome segregation protein SMC [Candidatus Raskinella chloraquaticus]|uniref:chromosome segregation protein SMC n=1 Tax=Candidatus Raskinella chloraquaticus TaxID=1951219 RepID=UPI00366FF923
MKFTKLRLAGFKSFVEPTDILIEQGLTGIVGPNGCGKSNLTEALRWVMGESSTKSMRAGGMDEVIFAGTTTRPSRNSAEVTLYLDNTSRTAPSAFNDADHLEVSRRIERDGGSSYRVNSRDVRARDVQLLFADASSGARSPALVRQGQIAELISAKPQSRRRLIEEAAGIAGLHARRHETELRLKGAEANLERLQDVLQQMASQLEGLKKQARQAGRYRQLSGEIRESEALVFYCRHSEAREQRDEAGRLAELDVRAVAAATEKEAAATTEHARASFALPALREAEARAAAALQRLSLAREGLDAEEKRAREKAESALQRITQLEADIARETAISADTAVALARLAAEGDELQTLIAAGSEAEAAAGVELKDEEMALEDREQALARSVATLSDTLARRQQMERSLRELGERLARLAGERDRVSADIAALTANAPADGQVGAARAAVARAAEAVSLSEATLQQSEATLALARNSETAARGPLSDAERDAARLGSEAQALRKVLSQSTGGRWRPVLEEITAARGYEAALGAALGDDLDAAIDPAASMHWAGSPLSEDDPALPAGVEALASHINAPPALARRLSQIGLVTRAEGPRLASGLKSGQRLVSREGDLWRWDGFVAAAEAPSAAARRLAEKNRLADVESAAAAAVETLAGVRAAYGLTEAALKDAAAAEQAARAGLRAAEANLNRCRADEANAERAAAALAAKLAALGDARRRILGDHHEGSQGHAALSAELSALPGTAAIEAEVAELRLAVNACRGTLASARARHQALTREAALRAQRLTAVIAEQQQWQAREARSGEHVADLRRRFDDARGEYDELDGLPGLIREKRLALLNEVDGAEKARTLAADRLAEGESALAECDRRARAASQALGEMRERRVRSEARHEAARERLAQVEVAILDALQVPAARLPVEFGFATDRALPALGELETRLENLKRERERLGAVNLRADEEASEVEAQLEGLQHEKEDLEGAIRRLRTGIGTLNREGRERLLAAFAKVNTHFQRLFVTLFGGGAAELVLTESDDPLEAGLDIFAKPPGKKQQSLSLLSGGEQTLTATALIFAVFLTNPAPICVLDEVDAPLDDHNVERYCDLLIEMTRITSTRFMVITHNPITMARMHRLFGVTMAERGVSQLVSVDLESAERLIEAA